MGLFVGYEFCSFFQNYISSGVWSSSTNQASGNKCCTSIVACVPVRPKNKSKTAKGGPCERRPLLTARRRRRPISCVPAFAVQVRNQLGGGGCVHPVSPSRIALQTAESASPSNFFLSTCIGRWPWDHPPGDQCPTLGPEYWLRPQVCCQC